MASINPPKDRKLDKPSANQQTSYSSLVTMAVKGGEPRCQDAQSRTHQLNDVPLYGCRDAVDAHRGHIHPLADDDTVHVAPQDIPDNYDRGDASIRNQRAQNGPSGQSEPDTYVWRQVPAEHKVRDQPRQFARQDGHRDTE